MWILLSLFILNISRFYCLDVYHETSKITFYPSDFSEYFGYTVLLSSKGLIVGAPKAKSTLIPSYQPVSPGQVFICDLSKLDIINVTCLALGATKKRQDVPFQKLAMNGDFFKDDMWLGATIGVLQNDILMMCAPRWSKPYKDTHLLANGACYVQTENNYANLYPLKDRYSQAFISDGSRKEYGEYGTHLNYYAYGQSGFSMKVVDNSSVIIGAPGILQWTGGIVEYKLYPYFSKQPVANPYFNQDLGPDDYFGYSVESGIFEKDGYILYVGGAPRSKGGYGLVLVFRHTNPLEIKAKIRGTQLGAYFGATLLCTDLNGDGISDILVGAPNFVTRNAGLPYDQGAVFVYLTNNQKPNLTINFAGCVFGSGESGAKFGSAMADLGDIDGDGYNDVAIGSPWENSGRGAVYIYKGDKNGLKAQYIQKITVQDSMSFGISISKGFDIDKNNCSDLAVGAHNTQTAYVFRCIPTIQVDISIEVPDAMNLEEYASNFTALFCVKAKFNKLWPHTKIDVRASVIIDVERNRAKISGDSEYQVTIQSGNSNCDEQVVEVTPTADLSKPISMKFNVEPIELSHVNSTSFPHQIGRLSENSILQTSFDIQLMRGCGDDLICVPLLLMTLEPLSAPYVPGTSDRLGVRVTVVNKEEPAFGAKVHLTLPASLKRQPSGCSLDGNNLTCTLPAPLLKFKPIQWEIELEYTRGKEKIFVEAELKEPFLDGDEIHKKNISIAIRPKANFTIGGKALPNVTITVTRDKINKADNVTFVHFFEVTNFGPSDWLRLPGIIVLSDKVNFSNQIKGCSRQNKLECTWEIPAKTSLPVVLPLRIDLGRYGMFLKERLEHNVSTTMIIYHEGKEISSTIITRLILEPAAPIWPFIVGGVFGVILLTVIVYMLHRCGFFSRKRYNKMKDGEKIDNSHTEGTSYNTEDADTLPINDLTMSTDYLVDDSD